MIQSPILQHFRKRGPEQDPYDLGQAFQRERTHGLNRGAGTTTIGFQGYTFLYYVILGALWKNDSSFYCKGIRSTVLLICLGSGPSSGKGLGVRVIRFTDAGLGCIFESLRVSSSRHQGRKIVQYTLVDLV